MSANYILNVRRMIEWGDMVRKLGFAVFVPGIDFLCGVVTGNWDYGVAFANSQPFLARADIMVVCPGWSGSSGTAKEILTATKLCVPIYYEQNGIALLKDRLIKGDAYWQPYLLVDKLDVANDVASSQGMESRDDIRQPC